MSGFQITNTSTVSAATIVSVPIAPPVLQDYLSKIPPQNFKQPKFMAIMAFLIQACLDIQAVFTQLNTLFDLDNAVGVQLDAVGQWVGVVRRIPVPIENLYFSLDTPNLGFDQGIWFSPFDPTTSVVILDDDTYRCLLRAKVLLNKWDGTKAELYMVLDQLFTDFPGTKYSIVDNQNMTMEIALSGSPPSAALLAVIQTNFIPLSPVTVGINYVIPAGWG
jgi:hypothetical protein